MTYDELLAKIDYTVAIYEGLSVLDIRVLTAYLTALRAVVELHKPQEKLPNTCQECDYYGDWPCSTVQAIEGQLK